MTLTRCPEPDCDWTSTASNPRSSLSRHRVEEHGTDHADLESPTVLRGGAWRPNGRGTLVWVPHA